jgi:hypothetical protein
MHRLALIAGQPSARDVGTVPEQSRCPQPQGGKAPLFFWCSQVSEQNVFGGSTGHEHSRLAHTGGSLVPSFATRIFRS